LGRKIRLHHLRHRVFASLLVAGMILVPLLSAVLWWSLLAFEDVFFRHQVDLEADRLVAARIAGADATPAGPRFLAAWSLDEIPERYRTWSSEVVPGFERPVAELDSGTWEAAESDWFVAIRSIEGARLGDAATSESRGTLRLFYDVRGLEPLEGLEWRFLSSAGLVFGLVVLGVALGLAGWLDRQVLIPIRELARAAASWDLEDWKSRPLGSDDRPDEIGQLARSSRSAAQRIRGFLVRERRFTRNASHELRSPLTVIQGATELLRGTVDGPRARPLERIERAVVRMQSTIETFLWLAREEKDVPSLPVEVEPAIEECLATVARRPGRHHDVRVEVASGLQLPISPEAMRIVLDNLLGNAFRHGAEGEIRIAITRESIAVTNPLERPLEDPQRLCDPFVGDGSGIGLAIVDDLCDRYGWRLRIEGGEAWVTVRVDLAGAASPRTRAAATIALP
jgi:signal transduction histidine kinase